jgi:hypothetical protein
VARVAVTKPPRLAGVIFMPTGASAIFAPDEGKPAVVADGGRIGDYVVKSITPDHVVLTGPGGERAVRVTFDPGMRVTPHVLPAVNEGARP